MQLAQVVVRVAAIKPLVAEKQDVGGGHEVAVVAIVDFPQHMHIGGNQLALALGFGQQGARKIDIAQQCHVALRQRLGGPGGERLLLTLLEIDLDLSAS